jgi:pSer/pThr/pTyr-binding forkhead associated (FHA) protein
MAILTQYKNNVAGIRLEIDKPLFRIGRDPEGDLCIDDDLVSREHAIIEQLQGGGEQAESSYVLRDLESTNGTFVNHERITAHLLVDGDIIRAGKSFFLYSKADGPNLSATTKLHKSIIPGLYYTRTPRRER